MGTTPTEVVRRHCRLLQIVRLLQAGRAFNADQLAERLHVCRRTIFRDLNLIREAGLEVVFDDELQVYRLHREDAWGIAPELTDEQLATLICAVHVSLLQNVPEAARLLQETVDRLLSKTPLNLRRSIVRLIRSFHVCPTPDGVPRFRHILTQLMRAIRDRKQLRMTLDRAWADHHDATARFAPYRVELTAGRWQLMGRCSYDDQVRSVELRQIQDLQLTDESYSLPRQYDR